MGKIIVDAPRLGAIEGVPTMRWLFTNGIGGSAGVVAASQVLSGTVFSMSAGEVDLR